MITVQPMSAQVSLLNGQLPPTPDKTEKALKASAT
jgi:hypothetical protein